MVGEANTFDLTRSEVTEMGLSQTVIRELRQELDRLNQGRQHIDERINGIQVVLGAVNNGHNSQPRIPPRAGRRSPKSHRNELTLREAILNICRKRSSGDVDAVTKRLTDGGFRVGGTTSLRERAAHELRLMRLKGILTQDGDKKYRLNSKPVKGRRQSAEGSRRIRSRGDDEHPPRGAAGSRQASAAVAS